MFKRNRQDRDCLNQDESKVEQNPQRKRLYIGLAIVVLATICLVALVAFGSHMYTSKGNDHKEWSSAHENVAVLHIKGIIEETGSTYNQAWLEAEIRKASNDKKNKGLVLLIDSPGGTIYESDATWYALERYKKESKRPIFAYCQHLCASGGYYIGSSANAGIYADRNSLIGSIGVIGGQFVDGTGLLEKMGIKITTIHSGANKLLGSFSEPTTNEQLALMQAMSDEAYEQFVDVVAKGRKQPVEEIKKLADGRIYSAKQTVKNGLIDGVLSYEEFKEKVLVQVGQDVKLIDKQYEKPASYIDKVMNLKTFLGESDLDKAIKVVESLDKRQPMYLYQG